MAGTTAVATEMMRGQAGHTTRADEARCLKPSQRLLPVEPPQTVSPAFPCSWLRGEGANVRETCQDNRTQTLDRGVRQGTLTLRILIFALEAREHLSEHSLVVGEAMASPQELAVAVQAEDVDFAADAEPLRRR